MRRGGGQASGRLTKAGGGVRKRPGRSPSATEAEEAARQAIAQALARSGTRLTRPRRRSPGGWAGWRAPPGARGTEADRREAAFTSARLAGRGRT